MSMHITAMVVLGPDATLDEPRDLGYWEGDPPAIGDTVEIDGAACQVLRRHWLDCLQVRLLVEPNPTEVWMFAEHESRLDNGGL